MYKNVRYKKFEFFWFHLAVVAKKALLVAIRILAIGYSPLIQFVLMFTTVGLYSLGQVRLRRIVYYIPAAHSELVCIAMRARVCSSRCARSRTVTQTSCTARCNWGSSVSALAGCCGSGRLRSTGDDCSMRTSTARSATSFFTSLWSGASA